MNKNLLGAVTMTLMLCAASAGAQAPRPAPTNDTEGNATPNLLFPSTGTPGGYGAPEVKVTSMLGAPAVLVGGQASWIISHRYLIGTGLYGLATTPKAPSSMEINGAPSSLQLAYGGVRLGVVDHPDKLLHLAVVTLVGMGGLQAVSQVPVPAELEVGTDRPIGHSETFFVLEPEVDAELNVTSFMRLGVGASYRFITGVEQPGLPNDSLSGPAAMLALRFGWF